MRLVHQLIFGALLLLLSGCAGKAIISPQLSTDKIKQIAVLPVSYSSGITRERIDYLRQQLVNELKGSGFLVLDDATVQRICSSPACPERKKLASDYLVDSFAELNISSANRANFVAGYYNNIDGELKITDKNSKELFSLKHTESEKGGLLFNSGQIFQGLKSTAKNLGKDSANNLADRFAKNIVAEIPSPAKVKVSEDSVAVSINSVDVMAIRPPVYKVCSRATPHSMAFLVLNKQKTNLREVSPGNYCGIYSLAEAFDMSLTPKVEVRSPFGNSTRRDLDMNRVPPICRLSGKVNLLLDGGSSRLSISETPKACEGNRFLVYKGSAMPGPFEKVAEFKGASWKDSKSNPNAIYQVVAINRDGVRSQPAAADSGQDKS